MYRAQDWYWIVGGDATRLWSSKNAKYVPLGDPGFAAWLVPPGNMPTRIDSELLLYDALAKAGFAAGAPARAFSGAEILTALLAVDRAQTLAAFGAVDPLGIAGSLGAGDARLIAAARAMHFSLP